MSNDLFEEKYKLFTHCKLNFFEGLPRLPHMYMYLCIVVSLRD